MRKIKWWTKPKEISALMEIAINPRPLLDVIMSPCSDGHIVTFSSPGPQQLLVLVAAIWQTTTIISDKF